MTLLAILQWQMFWPRESLYVEEVPLLFMNLKKINIQHARLLNDVAFWRNFEAIYAQDFPLVFLIFFLLPNFWATLQTMTLQKGCEVQFLNDKRLLQ